MLKKHIVANIIGRPSIKDLLKYIDRNMFLNCLLHTNTYKSRQCNTHEVQSNLHLQSNQATIQNGGYTAHMQFNLT